MVQNLRIALLAAWLGAIVYFATAVAPNAFAVLTPQVGGRALAGDIVSRALALLHYFGMGCAVVFLLLGLRRLTSAGNALVLVMLGLTLFSQFWVTPTVHLYRNEPKLRATHGIDFDQLPADDPARKGFDWWHRVSTATEGVILLLGIGALVIESRRD